MNIEDVKKVIDETCRRTGGRMPARLICGQKLFRTLCDEAKIEVYDAGMAAKFYGIPITVVYDMNLVEEDKMIVVPENWDCIDYTTTYHYCDWWNKPDYTQFQTQLKDASDDINISEEEFLKILNGSG